MIVSKEKGTAAGGVCQQHFSSGAGTRRKQAHAKSRRVCELRNREPQDRTQAGRNHDRRHIQHGNALSFVARRNDYTSGGEHDR